MHPDRGIKLNFATGVVVEFALVLLVVVSTLFWFGRGVSVSFVLTFIVLVPIVLHYYSSHEPPSVLHLLILFTLVNVLFNTLRSAQATITFSYFYKMIMFFCTMVFFCAACQMRVDKKSKEIIASIPLIMGALMAASYFFFGNRAMIAQCITLGFVNSNFAGMWLTHVFLYTAYFFVVHKRAVYRILSGGFMVICLYLIWKTYARSCFAGLAFFFVLMGFGFLKKTYKLSPVLIIASIMAPILFVLVYLNIVSTKWFYNLIYVLIRTGKKIDARDQIWRIALGRIKNSPIIGCYSESSGGRGVFQLHNTHLDVLCSYGVIPFALFIAALEKITRNANQRINSPERYVAFCAFLSIIIVGCFEAAIVAGSTGLYILTGGFLILAIS